MRKTTDVIKILLVGAGNLGSRYLEGLLKLEDYVEVDIIEPSKISIDNCKSLIKNLDFTNKKLNFKNTFPTTKNSYQIAIVATTADVRDVVLEKITNSYSIKYCILEKLLAQSLLSLNRLKNSVNYFDKAWVNNCMRIMKWHKEMKETIFSNNKTDVKAVLTGKGWGMACNAIHYIDLLSWWTNSKIEVINTDQIKSWQPSKRIGFYECFGKIKVYFEKGNYLELNCDTGNSDLIMKIDTVKEKWELNETTGITIGSNSQKISGVLEYQSSMTAPLVDRIIYSGNCYLTSFEESYIEHEILL